MSNNRNGKGMLGRKRIDRGPAIEVKNKISLNDVKTTEEEQKLPQVTLPVNIRVDNHIKNKLQALISLGYFDTYKGFVEASIDEYLNNLDDDENRKIEYIVNKLELKDYEKSIKNKK